jgi:hypothetical protein
VRVELGEVEFSGDQKNDGADGSKSLIAARFSLRGLEQAIDGFEETVGLARADPGEDAFEVVADQACDLFHRIDLGSHHVGAPLSEQGSHDIGLFTCQYLAQLLAIVPGPGGAFSRHLHQQQRIEFLASGAPHRTAVLQQCPAQSFDRRIYLLFEPPRLVDRCGGMGYDVEFIERDLRIREMLADSLMKAGEMSMLIASIWLGRPR